MKWLEVSVRVIPEAAEAVSEVLSRYAPEGIAVLIDTDAVIMNSPVVVKAYLVVDKELEDRKRKLEEGLWYLHKIWPVIPEPTYRPIADQDWTVGWKETIPVLHIGRRVVIKPTWRTYKPHGDEVVLELDPGMAFGSGLHPTTQLCIEVLEHFLNPGMKVLDIGTGTGILAIAAAKLGAVSVLAVDTDADAITAARRNIFHNHTQEVIHLKPGSLADVKDKFDIVLANVLAPTIISMVESNLARVLCIKGFFVASGILLEQVDDVKDALHSHALKVIETRQKADWAALVAGSTHQNERRFD
jgi:ribosomal protein L11 methyltransferase